MSRAPMLVDTDVLIWHLRGYPGATTANVKQFGAVSGLVIEEFAP